MGSLGSGDPLVPGVGWWCHFIFPPTRSSWCWWALCRWVPRHTLCASSLPATQPQSQLSAVLDLLSPGLGSLRCWAAGGLDGGSGPLWVPTQIGPTRPLPIHPATAVGGSVSETPAKECVSTLFAFRERMPEQGALSAMSLLCSTVSPRVSFWGPE